VGVWSSRSLSWESRKSRRCAITNAPGVSISSSTVLVKPSTYVRDQLDLLFSLHHQQHRMSDHAFLRPGRIYRRRLYLELLVLAHWIAAG
jgi:hypothetical protein